MPELPADPPVLQDLVEYLQETLAEALDQAHEDMDALAPPYILGAEEPLNQRLNHWLWRVGAAGMVGGFCRGLTHRGHRNYRQSELRQDLEGLANYVQAVTAATVEAMTIAGLENPGAARAALDRVEQAIRRLRTELAPPPESGKGN